MSLMEYLLLVQLRWDLAVVESSSRVCSSVVARHFWVEQSMLTLGRVLDDASLDLDFGHQPLLLEGMQVKISDLEELSRDFPRLHVRLRVEVGILAQGIETAARTSADLEVSRKNTRWEGDSVEAYRLWPLYKSVADHGNTTVDCRGAGWTLVELSGAEE